MKNKVLLMGTGHLAVEVTNYFREQGLVVCRPREYWQGHELIALVDLELGMDHHKQAMLVELERRIPVDLPIFTSALHRTVTEIASWLRVPSRVVGFSPLLLPTMERIEVSRPLQAMGNPNWLQYCSFWKEQLKEIEEVGDAPGLVFPRMIALLVNEAVFALNEKIANVEDIDLAMRMGTSFPHGPLEWADQIGIDQIYGILTGLFREYGEDRYRPALLLRKMVYANYLGVDVGKGFYLYE